MYIVGVFKELDKRRYMQLAEYYKPERLFASAIKVLYLLHRDIL